MCFTAQYSLNARVEYSSGARLQVAQDAKVFFSDFALQSVEYLVMNSLNPLVFLEKNTPWPRFITRLAHFVLVKHFSWRWSEHTIQDVEL